jgi:hypothetical protein
VLLKLQKIKSQYLHRYDHTSTRSTGRKSFSKRTRIETSLEVSVSENTKLLELARGSYEFKAATVAAKRQKMDVETRLQKSHVLWDMIESSHIPYMVSVRYGLIWTGPDLYGPLLFIFIVRVIYGSYCSLLLRHRYCLL